MRRIAQPIEIAQAVLFFVSDRANYVTGQVLSVSGGLTNAGRCENKEEGMQKYCLAAAFGALATIALAAPASAQAMPTNNPEAMANVRQSEAYTNLLRTNPGFRRKREQIECGPITDSQLRQSCIASFEAYAQPAPARRRH